MISILSSINSNYSTFFNLNESKITGLHEFDSFIKEIWFIRSSICHLHKTWTKYPLSIDTQLISGFFSALQSFSTNFKSSNLRNIDFMDSRFFLVSQDMYSLIIRTSEIPLKRALQHIKNFTIEFENLIDQHPKLHQLKSNESSLIINRDEKFILEDLMEQTKFQIAMTEKTIQKMDLFTLINLLKSFLQISNILFITKDGFTTSQTILSQLINNPETDIDNLPHFSYSDLMLEMAEFFSQQIETMLKVLINSHCTSF